MAVKEKKPISQEKVQRTKGVRPTPEIWQRAVDSLDPELVRTALAEKTRQDPSFIAKYQRTSLHKMYNHIHARGLGELGGHEGTVDPSQTVDYANYGQTRLGEQQ